MYFHESGVEAVLSKARKIVGHFRHSPENDEELQTEQSKLNQKSESLMQDVSIHWNSTLQMIQRLIRNKAAVFDNPHHKHNLLNESESENLE